jgi:PleD family two-component response regulator
MMTYTTNAEPLRPNGPRGASLAAAQKVVIVNGSATMLGLLESAFDAGRYDVMFAESSGHAYSQIKREHPDLVILCVHIDDADGFHLLSMLKLDDETRDIPVLTCTSEFNVNDEDPDTPDPLDTELFVPKPAVSMN